MKEMRILQALGQAEEAYVAEAAPADMGIGAERDQVWHRKKRTLLLIAAVIALLGTITAAADFLGFSLLDWIASAMEDPDRNVLQEQVAEGEWIYLNGDNVAVIVPESPVKILLSADGGDTWRETTVEGSQYMYFHGQRQEDMTYYGGYIGFNGGDFGYLVLTTGVSMNHQGLRIFLTEDGGDTYREIGNPYESHVSVLTGAGFASEEVGFISYRYFEDAGPDIWWTEDGGETWSRLSVELPAAYQEGYVFTPGSPVFEGEEGVYPITAAGGSGETTLYLYSHDGGRTWEWA